MPRRDDLLIPRSNKDAPMFPGGGYNDRNGYWITDHRTVGECQRDAITFLLAVFVGAPVLLVVVVVAALVWL